MQQQQRWQRNATSQTTNKSNDKTPKTSHNYLLQHYCLTSSTRKIRTRSSFCKRNVPREIKPNVPLGGRISHFLQSCENLTKDQEILEIVKGYKIPLLKTPVQEKIPMNTSLKDNQKFLMEKEIKEM